MADELPVQPASGGVAKEIAPASGSVPTGEQQPSNNRLAAILAKQAANEPLTRAEAGYLGSVRKRAAKKVAAVTSENVLLHVEPEAARMEKPPASPADNPLFDDGAEAPIQVGGLALSAADSATIRMAAEAILDSMDTATKLYIGHEARAAGCDEKTVAAYEAAVALNPRNRELMAGNGEPVVIALCKFFGCSPDKLAATLKNSAFMCGLFAHVTSVAATVKSIRESRLEKAASK